MDRTAQAIENHKNIIVSTNSTIASIGLTKIGQKVGGILVTPAVWVLNYSTQDAVPDEVDVGLYAMGFFGGVASVAAIGTGIIKALVDDDIDRKLAEIQLTQEHQYRPFIKACSRYAMSSPQINAMTIASQGGTAWKHTNGLWVYITDIHGRLVHNYSPTNPVMTYRPTEPLENASNGKFKWKVFR